MSEQSEAIAQMSFEAALKRLEEIVRKLESGEAPLDESIELYEEGERLKQQCEARLKAAQARIEKIQIGRDGQPAGTVPFDGE
ncbi:exodeoxyribonuclease VII small subunit [Sphingosinicella humi]|uniref:Exodeoxyribonuclease 7 small subunit n=1 Tax=Allosphingosinicella humi TaxID=2068657 RepID=A0A2U2IZT1_9SPHN|nr:exodeoxyribonuclease VII small subunit [Sphingosinicella humi]PWG01589.1 exodeoxyribonuclease VII small subunit [Sphingosinicella humi]